MPVLGIRGSASVRNFGFGGKINVPPGQQAYTTAGTYTWVCPANVTSVCIVLVGSGGGRGGPNTSNDSTGLGVTAYGGRNGSAGQSANRGEIGLNYDGGGIGGPAGFDQQGDGATGGGGAGGYSGNGGTGGGVLIDWNAQNGSNAPTGGGGGGGSASYDINIIGGGGGVGILGQGASGSGGNTSGGAASGGSGGGAGGVGATTTGGAYGGGGPGRVSQGYAGSGGSLAYKNNIVVTPGASYTIVVGATNTNGGNGAARIIWGTTITRAFPSTNTGNL